MFSEQYNYDCEKLSGGGGGGFSSQANSIFYSIDTFPGQTNFIDDRRLIVKKRLHLYLEFCRVLILITNFEKYVPQKSFTHAHSNYTFKSIIDCLLPFVRFL